MIFRRFVAIGSATKLAKALVAESVRTKSGRPVDKGYIYRLLNSQVYLGEATHKDAFYPGEHAPIIDRSLWDKVHSILQTSPRLRAANARARTPALLKGLIFTETGCAMTPAFTKKGTRLYRYYVSMDVIRNRALDENPGPLRLPAPMVVVTSIRWMTPSTTPTKSVASPMSAATIRLRSLRCCSKKATSAFSPA